MQPLCGVGGHRGPSSRGDLGPMPLFSVKATVWDKTEGREGKKAGDGREGKREGTFPEPLPYARHHTRCHQQPAGQYDQDPAPGPFQLLLSLLSPPLLPVPTSCLHFVTFSPASVGLLDHQNGSYRGHWTFSECNMLFPELISCHLLAACASVDTLLQVLSSCGSCARNLVSCFSPTSLATPQFLHRCLSPCPPYKWQNVGGGLFPCPFVLCAPQFVPRQFLICLWAQFPSTLMVPGHPLQPRQARELPSGIST